MFSFSWPDAKHRGGFPVGKTVRWKTSETRPDRLVIVTRPARKSNVPFPGLRREKLVSPSRPASVQPSRAASVRGGRQTGATREPLTDASKLAGFPNSGSMIAITDGPTLVFTADVVPAEASDRTLSDTNFPAAERRNQRGSGAGRAHTDRSVSDVMTARSRQGFRSPIVTRNAIRESVFCIRQARKRT